MFSFSNQSIKCNSSSWFLLIPVVSEKATFLELYCSFINGSRFSQIWSWGWPHVDKLSSMVTLEFYHAWISMSKKKLFLFCFPDLSDTCFSWSVVLFCTNMLFAKYCSSGVHFLEVVCYSEIWINSNTYQHITAFQYFASYLVLSHFRIPWYISSCLALLLNFCFSTIINMAYLQPLEP